MLISKQESKFVYKKDLLLKNKTLLLMVLYFYQFIIFLDIIKKYLLKNNYIKEIL